LVITKGSLDDYLDKLKQVFIQLHNAGLKINVTKSFFCTQETEYLGYILIRGGIKPQQKKGAGNHCAQSTQKCKRTSRIPW
jgi:hypothetical protein